MADDSTQALVNAIEKELLLAIVKNLEENNMSKEQAQRLAREFLALLPIHDKHELLEKLSKFSKVHVEAKSLFLKYGAPIEDEERKQKLELMSQHIQNGQIEHALNVAKGGSTNAGSA